VRTITVTYTLNSRPVSGGGGCLNRSAASRAPGNQLRLGVLGKSNPILSTMPLQKVDDRSIGTTA
jgi:hypothetical protein